MRHVLLRSRRQEAAARGQRLVGAVALFCLCGALLEPSAASAGAAGGFRCEDFSDESGPVMCREIEAGRQALSMADYGAALTSFLAALDTAPALAQENDAVSELFRAALLGAYYCEVKLKHYSHARRLSIELGLFRSGNALNEALRGMQISETREDLDSQVQGRLATVSVLIKQDRTTGEEIEISVERQDPTTGTWKRMLLGSAESSVSKTTLLLDPFHAGLRFERFSVPYGPPGATTSRRDFNLQADEGTYRVWAVLPGHRKLVSEVQRLVAGENKNPILIDYGAAPATLPIVWKPESAKLQMQGDSGPGFQLVRRQSSTTPLELAPGVYQLSISKFGYQTFLQRLQLHGAEQHDLVSIHLEPTIRRPQVLGPLIAGLSVVVGGLTAATYFGVVNREAPGGNTGVVFRPE